MSYTPDFPVFWFNNHPLTAESERLFEKLVPGSGMCDTVEGELLRAVCKIGHDWGNNGFGCNNWSGAVNYLYEHPVNGLEKVLEHLYQYSTGGPGPQGDAEEERVWRNVNYITECVIRHILELEAKGEPFTPNTVDMWSLADPAYEGEEEEEEYVSVWDDYDDDADMDEDD